MPGSPITPGAPGGPAGRVATHPTRPVSPGNRPDQAVNPDLPFVECGNCGGRFQDNDHASFEGRARAYARQQAHVLECTTLSETEQAIGRGEF